MAPYKRPSTPAAVERELRQEAGFGCAKCGHPYVEYHHIIPFAEEQHFRQEDMVALCGNCHPMLAKLQRDRQYEVKANPHNRRTGRFNGALEHDKRDLVFKVGGNWYENSRVILRYFNQPIISCRLDDGQAKISLSLFDPFGHLLLGVIDNDISFRVDDLWDFECAHNTATARYGARDIALRLDFRGDTASIDGKLWLGSQQVELGPNGTTLPGGNTMSGGQIRADIAIQIGPPDQDMPRYRLV